MNLKNAFAMTMFLVVVILLPNLTVASRDLTAASDEEAVRSVCKKNLFPDECVKILMPFAGSFRGDLGKMCVKSVELSVAKTQETLEYLKKVQIPPGSDKKLGYLLGAGKTTVENTMDDLKDTVDTIKKLVPKPNVPDEQFKESVQALQMQFVYSATDLDDIFDEFPTPDSPTKADIVAHLTDLIHYFGVSGRLLYNYMGP
ncbi:PREDICTED: uncharacterized protein LOC104823089 [Tarenaya hassleriana]|uniref:uncharacterized protein LOC104823089 n=1 Tax=Tarenaya hassleriana TaxID=28532 RepID=UPI00053C58F4|nr:PREDICTED: uncharacterized protein LOC104823089 [Tarenaya hassleriana]